MQSQLDKAFVERLLDELSLATRTRVEKPWGYEVMVEAPSFILKYIEIDEGHKTSLQVHEIKDEVTVVISGLHNRVVDGRTIMNDQPIRVLPGTVHRVYGPIKMMEITTPHNDDIIRLEDGYER